MRGVQAANPFAPKGNAGACADHSQIPRLSELMAQAAVSETGGRRLGQRFSPCAPVLSEGYPYTTQQSPQEQAGTWVGSHGLGVAQRCGAGGCMLDLSGGGGVRFSFEKIDLLLTHPWVAVNSWPIYFTSSHKISSLPQQDKCQQYDHSEHVVGGRK